MDLIKKVKEDVRYKGFSYVEEKDIDSLVLELNKDSVNTDGKIIYAKEKIDTTRYFVYDSSHFKPIRIISVVDYLYHVLNYEDDNVNRYFRGQKAHYDFLPSLFRDKGKYVEKEMEINAKVYNDRPEDFSDCHSTFEKLVKLKHYVHASRLIDISSSPLVALYFACISSSKEDKDVGVVLEIYCRKEDEKFSVSSDTVVMLTSMTNTKMKVQGNSLAPCLIKNKKSIVPKVDKVGSCFDKCPVRYKNFQRLHKILKIKNNKPLAAWAKSYIGELSHQCKKEGMTIYWDDVCFNELNQCILVKPPLNNDRIVRQQGSFIMCGMNPEDIKKPPTSLYDYLRYPKLPHGNLNGKEKDSVISSQAPKKSTFYYILAEDRDYILEELNVFGMNDYYFFPELEKEIAIVKSSVTENTDNPDKSERRKEWNERKNSAFENIFNKYTSITIMIPS